METTPNSVTCGKYASSFSSYRLSHGQSQTEREFNIHKKIFVEILKELSLISQIRSYDYMKDSGDDIASFFNYCN